MSAEAVIYALLSTDDDVTAAVGTRIYPEMLPEGRPAPALVYRLISQVQQDDVALDQAVQLMTARIQVDAIASNESYAARKALLLAVRRACHAQRGTIAGVAGVVVRALFEGPDLQHERAGLSSGSIDFQVVFQQAA